MEEGLHRIKIAKIKNGNSDLLDDVVAVEAPLEIRIKLENKTEAQSISVTMRTPGQDEILALGFLFTEGLIQSQSQVKDVKVTAQNTVTVLLQKNITLDLKKAERNFYTTSSCGVCGKSSIDAIISKSHYAIPTKLVPDQKVLFTLKEKLAKRQSLFTATGGIHAAALFNKNGTLLNLQEDVGRHNALDKIIGHTFLEKQLPLSNTILLLSGRASFELIQKATMAGIPTIVAVGAPSSLAVELAKENKQTLIGFLKEGSYNLYT